MKQTLDANIGGTIFHVEEDAYRRLEAYLASIAAYFASYEDRADIVSDIEGRVAEQLVQGNTSRIVSLADVERVIVVLGRVEQIADVEGETEYDGDSALPVVIAPNEAPPPTRRRLFRDMERGIVAGVAAGVGAFLGIPPFVVRIAMIVPSLFPRRPAHELFVVILLAYLLMWFMVPVAKTTTDALQMRGDPVTIAAVEERLRSRAPVIAPGTRNLAMWVLLRIGTMIRKTVIAAAWLACCAAAVFAAALAVGATAFLIISLANTKIGLAHELHDFIHRLGGWYFPFALCVYLLTVIPLILAMMGAISVLRTRNLIPIRWGVAAAGVWLMSLFVSVALWATYFFPPQ